MRVVVNHQHPKIPCPRGRVETLRYPGHWFVRWLARFIPFEPDILIVKPLMVDDPKMIRVGDMLLCSPAQAAELRRGLPPVPMTPICVGLASARPWFSEFLS